MIENSKNIIRIKLNEFYSIRKHKQLELWWLEYYNLGRNYMPIELYANKSLMKVYKHFKQIGGNNMKKIFLDWDNCTIIETENINNPDVGVSIKFINKQQMIEYIRKNRNIFKNFELYDQISDLSGNITFQKTEINSI